MENASERGGGTNADRKPSDDYGQVWDRYVRDAFPRVETASPYANRRLMPWQVLNTTDDHYEWPGDEWGDRETAARLLDASLTSALGGSAKVLCELGAGAGRYTVLALERFPDAEILSFDVSAEFERSLRTRCREPVDAGRLRTYLLDGDPLFLVNAVAAEHLLGKVDGIYSYDAMVHVDLHTLVVYWLSATRILRSGGVLVMSVADASSDNGLMKLLHDAPAGYRRRGNAGGHFMWLSPEIIEATLPRLGFEVSYPEGNGRDLMFCARLTDASRATTWLDRAGADWFVP